jgi:hypothetical protein
MGIALDQRFASAGMDGMEPLVMSLMPLRLVFMEFLLLLMYVSAIMDILGIDVKCQFVQRAIMAGALNPMCVSAIRLIIQVM